VVINFHVSQRKTLISVRLILLLIIVPFFTQYLSKALVVEPLVDQFRVTNETVVFLNSDLEQEALAKL
jgi:hypothetical protein